MPNITYKSCYCLFILLPAKSNQIAVIAKSPNRQSNCCNFSCSSIIAKILQHKALSRIIVLKKDNGRRGAVVLFCKKKKRKKVKLFLML